MSETLCWTCVHADKGHSSECPWARDFTPVDGWNAIYNKALDSYEVLECPRYKRDERLPNLLEYTCQCGATVIGRKTCPDCLAKKKEYMRQRKIELISKQEPVFKFSGNTCGAARIALQARYDEYKYLHGWPREVVRHRICVEAGCCRCGGKRIAGHNVCRRCYEIKKTNDKKRRI